MCECVREDLRARMPVRVVSCVLCGVVVVERRGVFVLCAWSALQLFLAHSVLNRWLVRHPFVGDRRLPLTSSTVGFSLFRKKAHKKTR